MGTPQPTCGDCYYFRSDAELVGFGECRAHPPTLEMIPLFGPTPDPEEEVSSDEDGILMLHTFSMPEQIGVTRRGVWPQVPVDGWCGEHERTTDDA